MKNSLSYWICRSVFSVKCYFCRESCLILHVKDCIQIFKHSCRNSIFSIRIWFSVVIATSNKKSKTRSSIGVNLYFYRQVSLFISLKKWTKAISKHLHLCLILVLIYCQKSGFFFAFFQTKQFMTHFIFQDTMTFSHNHMLFKIKLISYVRLDHILYSNRAYH